ncbi:uncharacterized protein GIQ15_06796 [Arthroderma uncinatum]|uniref:uncharacterized protein n=1 Tax=Arthroderma uncinatum TaxID=74035 RepID=UPI00144AB5E4|nr:uncharacterized protein GIQ15_06796 [Arthroderma uncinatum]KAF3479820.1 hypothetical protein GIQ15_06796 [Arthroderma uncinatum]
MSRVTPEETCIFLIKCIKHSNSGKVDFGAVAEECGIVTKGAAAKRYERILKGNGVHPSSNDGGDEDGAPGSPAQTPKKAGAGAKPKTPRKTPTKPKAAGVAKTPTKRKPKAANSGSPTKKYKSEAKILDSDASDKAEGEEADNKSPLRTSNDPFLAQAPADGNEEAMFELFCNTGAKIEGKNGAEMEADIA